MSGESEFRNPEPIYDNTFFQVNSISVVIDINMIGIQFNTIKTIMQTKQNKIIQRHDQSRSGTICL